MQQKRQSWLPDMVNGGVRIKMLLRYIWMEVLLTKLVLRVYYSDTEPWHWFVVALFSLYKNKSHLQIQSKNKDCSFSKQQYNFRLNKEIGKASESMENGFCFGEPKDLIGGYLKKYHFDVSSQSATRSLDVGIQPFTMLFIHDYPE